jgi:flagellin
VSVDGGGIQGNNASDSPSISGDGRYVAYLSLASNLVAADTNAAQDAFVSGNTLFSSSPSSSNAALTPLTGVRVATRLEALSSLLSLDGYFAEVDAVKGVIGAGMSRFAGAVATMRNTAENLTAAKSRIVDADIALESAALLRGRTLQQVGAAVLTQANQVPALALQLLEF